MKGEGQWFIFHITVKETNDGMNYTGVLQIDEKEKDELASASKAISDFYSSLNVVRSVHANRDDIIKSISSMVEVFKENPSNAQSVMENASFDISRQFANTCSLFRSFLDHFNRYYVHTYGKDSDKHKSWKASQSTEYDAYVGYRIVYMMRNYIQHYDMPPLSISITESLIKKEFSVEINIDMETLSKDKEISKQLNKKNDAATDKLGIVQVIDEWSASFGRIVHKATLERALEVKQSAEQVLSIRNRLSLAEGRIAYIFLPKVDAPPEKVSFNVNYLDEEKAEGIISFIDNNSSGSDEK